jgi:hypothetical protein
MASDPQRTAEAAKRALEDAEFAKAVLEGRENYPEVRQAILDELSSSDNEEVKGFALNPTARTSSASRALDTYISTGPKPGGTQLVELINKSNIANLANMAPKPW